MKLYFTLDDSCFVMQIFSSSANKNYILSLWNRRRILYAFCGICNCTSKKNIPVARGSLSLSNIDSFIFWEIIKIFLGKEGKIYLLVDTLPLRDECQSFLFWHKFNWTNPISLTTSPSLFVLRHLHTILYFFTLIFFCHHHHHLSERFLCAPFFLVKYGGVSQLCKCVSNRDKVTE